MPTDTKTITETTGIDRSLLIEGLGKGLRMIEAFSDDWPRMTATEAGQRTGLTRTAARRYLVSLVHYGYAETDGKHYWLTPGVLRLGQSYLEAARLPRLVQPFLQRLSLQTGETANLSVLDGHEVVYLVRSNSPRIVSIGFHVGARLPAHVVSPGPAVLSTFTAAALDDWLALRPHDDDRSGAVPRGRHAGGAARLWLGAAVRGPWAVRAGGAAVRPQGALCRGAQHDVSDPELPGGHLPGSAAAAAAGHGQHAAGDPVGVAVFSRSGSPRPAPPATTHPPATPAPSGGTAGSPAGG
jgi:IclR helix-turn-helix domain